MTLVELTSEPGQLSHYFNEVTLGFCVFVLDFVLFFKTFDELSL